MNKLHRHYYLPVGDRPSLIPASLLLVFLLLVAKMLASFLTSSSYLWSMGPLTDMYRLQYTSSQHLGQDLVCTYKSLWLLYFQYIGDPVKRLTDKPEVITFPRVSVGIISFTQ